MNARQRTVRISPPTNIITYRLEDRMVYVPLASSWKVGLHCVLHFAPYDAHLLGSDTSRAIRISRTRKC